IQDALTTRNQIAAELEAVVQTHQTALEDRDRVPEAEDRLKTIDPRPHTSGFTGLRDAEPPDKVAAALAQVAPVLQMLSSYLKQPLSYPNIPRSSTSTIEDLIGLLKTTAFTTQEYGDERSLRTYPLCSKGVPRFTFEYIIFRLNKDIQILLEGAYGLRVVDIRQTLPNLKYLLYVATAGQGELPARKADGVRGLLKGAPPDLRRVGSEESQRIALSGTTV
ncbi:hypothetical protein LTR49_025137, partial [Elasticomyces elasticus]